jgi:hypothetical protein
MTEDHQQLNVPKLYMTEDDTSSNAQQLKAISKRKLQNIQDIKHQNHVGVQLNSLPRPTKSLAPVNHDQKNIKNILE